jgi:hypothetical protein
LLRIADRNAQLIGKAMRLRGRLERLELIAKDLLAEAEKRWEPSEHRTPWEPSERRERLDALLKAIEAELDRRRIPEHERHLNRELTPRREAHLVEMLDRLQARLERGEFDRQNGKPNRKA